MSNVIPFPSRQRPGGRIARLTLDRIEDVQRRRVARRVAQATALADETGVDVYTCCEVLRRVQDDERSAREVLNQAKARHAYPLSDLPG